MNNRVKPLSEFFSNPDVRAYWGEVSKGIAARHQALDEQVIDCESCGGIGYVRAGNLPAGHPKFGQLFPCPDPNCPVLAKQRQDHYAKLCTLAQIPAGYKDLTFAEWEDLKNYPEYLKGKRDALGAALAFVEARDRDYLFTVDDAATQVGLPSPEISPGQRNSVAFYGLPGVGKTSLSIAVARALLEDRRAVVYVQLMEYFAAIKKTWKEGAEQDENEVLKHYQEAPVLEIDEYGVDVTDWRRERAYDLVNYRYAHRLPTIITTNYTADELTTVWGAPIGHRLQAMCHWYEMGGLELRARNEMVKSR